MLQEPTSRTAKDGTNATGTAVSASTSTATPAVGTPDPASAPIGCALCGRRYRLAGRYGDRFCRNECAFDFWAETGAYPNVILAAGTASPKRLLSERQLAARRAGLAKARAARLARIDGAKQAGQYQRLGTAAGDSQGAGPDFGPVWPRNPEISGAGTVTRLSRRRAPLTAVSTPLASAGEAA